MFSCSFEMQMPLSPWCFVPLTLTRRGFAYAPALYLWIWPCFIHMCRLAFLLLRIRTGVCCVLRPSVLFCWFKVGVKSFSFTLNLPILPSNSVWIELQKRIRKTLRFTQFTTKSLNIPSKKSDGVSLIRFLAYTRFFRAGNLIRDGHAMNLHATRVAGNLVPTQRPVDLIESSTEINDSNGRACRE